MGRRNCPAARVTFERGRKPVAQLRTIAQLLFCAHRQHQRKVFQRPYVRTYAESLVTHAAGQLPAEHPSLTTSCIPPRSQTNGQGLSRHEQQQQETLWDPLPPTKPQPQQQDEPCIAHPPNILPPPQLLRSQPQDEPRTSPAETHRARMDCPVTPPPPYRPSILQSPPQPSRRQQQQELLWGPSPAQKQQEQQLLAPSIDAAADDASSTGQEGQVGLVELLAQRDEALLMRGGRHRNRCPVSNTPEPQPGQLDLEPPGAATDGHTPRRPTQCGEGAWQARGIVQGQGLGGGGGGGNDGGNDLFGWQPGTRGAGGDEEQSIKWTLQQQPQLQGQTSQVSMRPGASGARRQSHEAAATAAAASAAASGGAEDAAGDPGGRDGDGGVSSSSSGSRKVILRLRRAVPEAAAPRRIRLPLPQRPKPWHVKLLSEAQQLEQQHQQGQAEQREQLQQLQGLELLGPGKGEDGGGGSGGVARLGEGTGQPPPPRQLNELNEGRREQQKPPPQQQQQQQQQQGQWRQQPLLERARFAVEPVPERGTGGLGGLVLGKSDTPATRAEEEQRRWPQEREERMRRSEELGSTMDQDEQRQGQAMRMIEVMQQQQQQREGTRREGQQGQQFQLKQQQQEEEEEEEDRQQDQKGQQRQLKHEQEMQQGKLEQEKQKQKEQQRRRLEQKSHAQPSTTADKAGKVEHADVVQAQPSEPCRTVAAHPDGTLWSYCTRDVGPLATRVLQQLLPPYQAGGRDGGAGESAAPPGRRIRGAVSDDGAVSARDASSCSGGGGPPCHVLVAGSYQAYTLLRALSYAQGALRLAAYNLIGRGSSSSSSLLGTSMESTAREDPILGFTAIGVSMPDLRLYYEQTVQHGTGGRPEIGPLPLPPPPSRSKPRQVWPENEAQLDPRVLVSVFLIQPPLDLLYGAATVPVARDGGGGGGSLPPPLAVSAAADVDSLARLLASRLRNYGSCQMQALGRSATSRALAILSDACRAVSQGGLGVLAFPRMSALGPQQRAELQPPPPAAAAAAARVPARGPRPQRDTGWPSAAAATAAATATTAMAEAALDPVLLDKAPQLWLDVVLCEWDDSGRPVVPEWREPLAPMPGAKGAAAATEPSLPAARSSGPGSEPLRAGKPQPQPLVATTRGERSGGDGRRLPSATLMLPPHRGAVSGRSCEDLELWLGDANADIGGCGGGLDTATASAAVARCVAARRQVVLAARNLGSLLRLPVVVFRAQGALRQLEWPLLRTMAFTLRRTAAGGARLAPGGRLEELRSQKLRSQQQQQQKQRPQQKQQQHGEVVAQAHEEEEEVDGGEAIGEDSLAAEVFGISMSALHYHLNSLPGPPPGHITASAVQRRLLPAAMNRGVYDGDSGGGSAGGHGNQRYVQIAAATATERLIRYGIATLAGTTPGGRLTALLAAACVSEGLMRSAGLTVLVRVDPRVRSMAAKPTAVQQQQRQRRRQRSQTSYDSTDTKPASVQRPLPPSLYQLLLARMDTRGGRLQLLRPDDLAAPSRGSATAVKGGKGKLGPPPGR